MRNERVCMVNSTHHYEYCPRCRQYATEPTWKIEFCSEECRNIYMTVNKFNFGHIDVKEATEELMKYDLSDRDNMKADLRVIIDALLPVVPNVPADEEAPVEAAPAKKFRRKIVNELD